MSQPCHGIRIHSYCTALIRILVLQYAVSLVSHPEVVAGLLYRCLNREQVHRARLTPLCSARIECNTSTYVGVWHLNQKDLTIHSAMAASIGDRHADDEEIAVDGREGIKDEEELYKRISWVLLPLFLVMVVLCYVDRTNLAFAGACPHSDHAWH